MHDLKIKIYNTFDDDKLKKEWQKIFEENHYFVQNSYEWCHTWWKYFHSKNRILHIATVESNGNIVGIAPMFILLKPFHNQLKFIGAGLTDFHELIIIKNELYISIFDLLLSYFKSYVNWNIILFDHINNETNEFQHFKTNNIKCKLLTECIILDLDGLNWKQYLTIISSKNFRKLYKRRRNKFEREKNKKLEVIKDSNDIREYLDKLFEVHARRWDTVNKDSKFKQPEIRSFLRDILCLLSEKRLIILYVLLDDDNIISYRLGFLNDNTYFDWNTGYDPEYEIYAPGKLITGYIIEDLINNKFRYFNFMRGGYYYKKQWIPEGKEHISENYQFVLGDKSLTGRISEYYYLRLRDPLKSIFKILLSNRYIRFIFKLDKQ
ncbi:MAG: GNAT family N-acetyltransferase [Candidatus Lokiarchaeota archaeon]|nr:GNAT family N-acetyltransferase [Candidatus Lokiarchaeota archaeon]